MLMVFGVIVVLVGVIVGWYTVAGSGINHRPYGKGDAPGAGRMRGESPLDSPWRMHEWSRGTRPRRRGIRPRRRK